MSRFYGSLDGGGQHKSTRCGHKHIEGHIRGWGVGIRVVGNIDDKDRDVFRIYTTGGSSSSSSDRLIATIRQGDDGPVVELA